ncbi:MAG TPA: metallophosphoesterase [Pseudomonadales bacterium]|nr:metallophosphoesterase [Pseudomonadales bacterium]
MSEASRTRVELRRLRALALPATIFTVVYFGMLVYPPLRLADLLWPTWQPGTPTLLGLILLPILGRVAYELRPGAASRHLAALSLTWLGLAFLLFCVLVPFELVALVVTAESRTLGMSVAGLWLLLGGWSLVNAQRLTVKRMTLEAGPLTRPVRMVQISDVHIGSRGGAFLDRVVSRIEPLAPDLVMITGDLVDFRDIPLETLAPLGRLQVPLYFCIGNHERYVDCDDICERLRSVGVRVLREEIDLALPPLVIVGLDDADSRHRVRDGLAALGPLPEGYRILLYHRPDGLEDAADAGVDLMLCGHTHNGQIIPFNFLVRRVFPRILGLYRIAPTQLYVSPGTGTWGPVMRLGSSNEITVIELVPGPEGSRRANGPPARAREAAKRSRLLPATHFRAPASLSSASTASAMRR